MSATVLLGLAVACAALSLPVCQRVHTSFQGCRRAPGDGHRLVGRNRTVTANAGVALAAYGIGIALFGTYLLDPGRASRWWAPVLVLLLYDCGYYWLHRGLHQRTLMLRIHRVHHRTQHPTAVDALYLHPLETAAGLVVLFGCVAAVGPLGVGSFVLTAALHTLINVLHHANLRLPSRLAWLCNHWSARHDAHHHRGGNYGSITPLWDWLFGTSTAARPHG